MAKIVYIHGIDNQRESEDLIEKDWTPALAGGIRLAGDGALADRLLLPRSEPDAIECRAAYYGHLFRSPDDRMSGAEDLRDLSPERTEIAEAIVLEWLERVAERAPSGSADAQQAQRTLDILREPEQAGAMGHGNVLREALRTLSRVSWLAKPGMGVVKRFYKALDQVTRYLTDEAIREQVQQIVSDLVTSETRVIIGHSLGSVVAYEAAHQLKGPLPLLVTLGSPLGLRTIVTERLRPAPSFPTHVTTWLNVANLEDVVAAEPDLRSRFAADLPGSSRFEGVRFTEPKDPHRVETYLGREPVGREAIQALS